MKVGILVRFIIRQDVEMFRFLRQIQRANSDLRQRWKSSVGQHSPVEVHFEDARHISFVCMIDIRGCH